MSFSLEILAILDPLFLSTANQPGLSKTFKDLARYVTLWGKE